MQVTGLTFVEAAGIWDFTEPPSDSQPAEASCPARSGRVISRLWADRGTTGGVRAGRGRGEQPESPGPGRSKEQAIVF